MTNREVAEAEGWSVTLSHTGDYVAHHGDEVEPTHVLDAGNEDDAWAELCGLEGFEAPVAFP